MLQYDLVHKIVCVSYIKRNHFYDWLEVATYELQYFKSVEILSPLLVNFMFSPIASFPIAFSSHFASSMLLYWQCYQVDLIILLQAL